MTEHEDVEIGRCFFRHTGTNCNVNTSRDVRVPKYKINLRLHTIAKDCSFKIGQSTLSQVELDTSLILIQ